MTTVNPAYSNNGTVSSGQINLSNDYNTFLKLLTTQLRNQDPLSPMDTNNFTQQLVMMNGVQQQLQTNALLQTLVNQSSGSGPAVNLIGKEIQAASPSVGMTDGKAKWSYELGGKAAAATLYVTDNNTGKVVWSGAAPSLDKGQHEFEWDGTTATGSKLTSGDFTLSVKANDSDLQNLPTAVYVQGVVTGVQAGASGTLLNLGSTIVNYVNVTKIQNLAN